MTLAQSWESAAGLPPEVRATLDGAGELRGLEPLLIVPEYKVALPGGRRESQTDVFVLGRRSDGLVAIAVEGKVDEPFGPTIGERSVGESPGVQQRLKFLVECLGIEDVPPTVRYQLLHRTASAVLAARQYFAKTAVMLVHSFSESDRWFDDFAAFAALWGAKPQVGELVELRQCHDVRLWIGWCKGDQRFRRIAPSSPAGGA